MAVWLSTAKRHDLSEIGHNNGAFRAGAFRGVVLHVNVSHESQGTAPSWYASGGGPDMVCPNFQVDRDGTIHQLLPMNYSPWCQGDGNAQYAAIETGGNPDEPFSDAQVISIAAIVQSYHDELDMPYALANKPGERGLGTHAMGGDAWGGHPCPGKLRTNQRDDILDLARTGTLHRDLLDEIGALPGAPANLTYDRLLDDIAKRFTKTRIRSGVVTTSKYAIAQFLRSGELAYHRLRSRPH